MLNNWKYHNRSEECPVLDISTPVMVYYCDGGEGGDDGDLLAYEVCWHNVVSWKEWQEVACNA